VEEPQPLVARVPLGVNERLHATERDARLPPHQLAPHHCLQPHHASQCAQRPRNTQLLDPSSATAGPPAPPRRAPPTPRSTATRTARKGFAGRPRVHLRCRAPEAPPPLLPLGRRRQLRRRGHRLAVGVDLPVSSVLGLPARHEEASEPPADLAHLRKETHRHYKVSKATAPPPAAASSRTAASARISCRCRGRKQRMKKSQKVFSEVESDLVTLCYDGSLTTLSAY
jgi:hypothetical protein